MDESWDDAAAGWDDDPGPRAYAAAAEASLRSELAERGVDLAGATVCDFGCGTGLLTERLVDDALSIDAVDVSQAMLDAVDRKVTERAWSNVRTARDIPPTRESHDLVACSSVCAFLDDYPGTAMRLASLLRPGGVFVQWDWEGDGADDHGLTRHEIRAALEGAGLVDVCVDTAFSVEVDGYTMSPLIGVGQRAASTE